MSDQTLEIEARPTKELFISMLIKDLVFKDAIGDLVDNSVDGARRIRGNGKYDGLWIKIEATKEHFKIDDNCGGIDAKLAREYAFRFGRPSDMPAIKHSVGQFGIGMKRALFKLGKEFKVESTGANSHFVVKVNVDEWKELDEWKFKFAEIKDIPEGTPEDKCGTSITVTNLHDDVIEQFKLENFISKLIKELRHEHLYNINKGITIVVNGKTLDAPQLLLLHSNDFKTAYWEKTYKDGMQVKIYAGISEPNLDEGGWYIFCNERLILGPEQSEITGWGGKGYIPKYHGQFNRFRGYVFFDVDDAGLLPLNTTKTNMDIDSPRFQAVRQEMILLMRPVIDFLNKLHDEGVRDKLEEKEEIPPLESAVESAKLVSLSDIDASTGEFKAPTPPPRDTTQPRMRRIQYSKPLDEIEEVQQVLGAQSLKEVGEKTFEYFMEMEVKN